MNLVQLFGMLARDAQFIRMVCKVESRRELATSKEAAERFHNFIRKPFVQWRERQAEHA